MLQPFVTHIAQRLIYCPKPAKEAAGQSLAANTRLLLTSIEKQQAEVDKLLQALDASRQRLRARLGGAIHEF